MAISKIFTNNNTQTIRLPADARFPASVKKVEVRVVGHDRIITPVDSVWDSFFSGNAAMPTRDFMMSRASQIQPDRESM